MRAIRLIDNANMCDAGEDIFDFMIRVLYLRNISISGANMGYTCTNAMRTRKEQLLEVIGAPKIEPLALKRGAPLPKGLPR